MLLTWCCELQAAEAGAADSPQLHGMLIKVPSGLCRGLAGTQAGWGPMPGVAATAIGAATGEATMHARLLGLHALSH
jgi:hypothetical protein